MLWQEIWQSPGYFSLGLEQDVNAAISSMAARHVDLAVAMPSKMIVAWLVCLQGSLWLTA